MKSLNFLMVVPNYGEPQYEFYLGLAYVSSYLKSKGFNVFCIDLNQSCSSIKKQVSESIEKNKIDVVCTGGMSLHYNQIDSVLNIVKEINPTLKTIVGGAIVTSDPQLAMENLSIDIGIIGEGEETVAELAGALSNGSGLEDVKGIIYYDSEHNLITTEPREPVSDLDLLPMPDYEGFGIKHLIDATLPNSNAPYYSVLDEVRPAKILASRSCPYRCTFCYHPIGSRYRQRSIDNIFSEIDYLVKTYNINYIFLIDDLFSINKDRMYEFAKRIKPYNLKWTTSLRVEHVDRDVLKAMKSSGLTMIGYGIESMSDTVLKSMKKGITTPQIERALKITREENIGIQGNIIFGDPNETEDTVKESLDWWEKHPEYNISLGLVIAFPSSLIYIDAVKSGIIKDKIEFIKSGFPVVNLTAISDRKFKQICDFVNFFHHFKKHFLIGKVVSSKLEYIKDNIRFYTFSVECPEGGQVSEYKNMHQITGKFNQFHMVLCRHCNAKMRISTKETYYKNYNILDKFLFCVGSILSRNDITLRFLYDLKCRWNKSRNR